MRVDGSRADSRRLWVAVVRQDLVPLAGLSMDEPRRRPGFHHQLRLERRVAVGGAQRGVGGDCRLRAAAKQPVEGYGTMMTGVPMLTRSYRSCMSTSFRAMQPRVPRGSPRLP